ncbi:hypothetical protein JMJ35_009685 [Cladonia borealis]|uniref:Translation initiation factor eIF2B subunit delta n=1 Tax=Cladonia borealis TaxID=184061 RepID=A0AA39QSS8_9LECA|nr:hypothetical protein JMJ35_009685 [Cladonia borealis]
MATPPDAGSRPAVAQGSNATEHPLENGVQHQHTASNSEQAPAVKGKAKDANGTENKKKTAEGSKDGKPSGKELKEKSKAEKVARRAQQKQAQQGQPVVDLGPEKQGDKDARKQSLAGPDSNFPKTQHKRTGSTSTGGQKPMPFRPAQAHAPPIKEEPKKENKNVALFDHLYGNPRRSTVAGASRDVHPAVLALGLQIRNYVICGSSARCVATLLAFKRVIESYITPPQTSLPRHLTTHLSSQIDYLVSCRPLSISMGNAIRWLKVKISEVDISVEEFRAKADLCNAIDNFITEKIIVADQVITRRAVEKIKDGDLILTYAKSSIVQQVLVEAYRKGKQFKVIVVDSRPLFEGKNLARALAELGLDVQYSLTHGISHVMKDATKVFLGAHAMMSDGRLYSRVGTALVAMTAKEANVPVIVCCESVKYTERVALDSFVHNEIAPPEELIIHGEKSSPLSRWLEVPNLQLLNLMYDLTPAEYITMVIDESGYLPPSSVPFMQRLSTNT